MPRDASPPRPPAGPVVFIGPRPVMSYVFEVVAQLSSGPDRVLVKARGQAISKAVDVVEVARRKFLDGAVDVGPIEIATERLVNREGREANVSSIAITLRRGATAPPPSPVDSNGATTAPAG